MHSLIWKIAGGFGGGVAAGAAVGIGAHQYRKRHTSRFIVPVTDNIADEPTPPAAPWWHDVTGGSANPTPPRRMSPATPKVRVDQPISEDVDDAIRIKMRLSTLLMDHPDLLNDLDVHGEEILTLNDFEVTRSLFDILQASEQLRIVEALLLRRGTNVGGGSNVPAV